MLNEAISAAACIFRGWEAQSFFAKIQKFLLDIVKYYYVPKTKAENMIYKRIQDQKTNQGIQKKYYKYIIFT